MTIVLRCPLYEYSKQPVQPPFFCFFLFLKPSSLAILAPRSIIISVKSTEHVVFRTPYTFSLPSLAHARISRDSSPF